MQHINYTPNISALQSLDLHKVIMKDADTKKEFQHLLPNGFGKVLVDMQKGSNQLVLHRISCLQRVYFCNCIIILYINWSRTKIQRNLMK